MPDAPSGAAAEPRRRLRRAVAVGLAVAAGYAAVYVATLQLSDRHRRPLFDGFGPSAPYRWVDPPAEFEQGNAKPPPSTSELPLGATGLPVGQASTDDGQLLINLPDGAVPPREGDVSVKIVLTPLAPSNLGPLPPKQYSDGNAYRVEISYQPSGQEIEALTNPGNILLTLPWGAPHLYRSDDDGRTWQKVEGASHMSGTNLAAPLTQLGTFVAATDLPVGSAGGGSDDGANVGLIVFLIALLAGALVLIPVLVRRSRRRKEAQKRLERRRAGVAKKQPERKKAPPRPAPKKKKKKR